MQSYVRIFCAAICLYTCSLSYAENEQSQPGAEEVVSKFYEYLRAGDTSSMDSLFFTIPAMESSKADWLTLIESVSQKVEDEQLDWEVVCAKELTDTAVVIVNQTMKQGKRHADPDAVFLVKENGRWLLLPDLFAVNAKDAVQSSLSNEQLNNRASLKKWAVLEIRGLSTECS